MLTKSNRFHGRKSLNAVYKYGENFNLNNISLRRLDRKPHQSTRVAVVVSKKVNKSAVVRNRIRRRVYEVIRLAQPNMNSKFDLVVNVYNEAFSTLPFSEVSETINKLLIKAGCITDK